MIAGPDRFLSELITAFCIDLVRLPLHPNAFIMNEKNRCVGVGAFATPLQINLIFQDETDISSFVSVQIVFRNCIIIIFFSIEIPMLTCKSFVFLNFLLLRANFIGSYLVFFRWFDVGLSFNNSLHILC
jgi:hypothetical protein